MREINNELKTRKIKVNINGEERTILTKKRKANDNKYYTYYAILSKNNDNNDDDFYKNRYLKLREKIRKDHLNRLKKQYKEV